MVSSHEEFEAKFYLDDLGKLKKVLDRISVEVVQPRTYERNLRFDTPDGYLSNSAQVLRLRKDIKNRITYKGPGEVKEGVSVRTEIEISVDDFDNAQALVEALGFQISMVYEKYRAVYELGEVLVTLDEMPFGNFAEIEGPDGASIQSICNQLGLVWEFRTLQSYTMLFEIVKKNAKLSFRDLTFENFTNVKIGPSQLEMVPADLE